MKQNFVLCLWNAIEDTGATFLFDEKLHFDTLNTVGANSFKTSGSWNNLFQKKRSNINAPSPRDRLVTQRRDAKA